MNALKVLKGQGLFAFPWDTFVHHFINVVWILVLLAAASTR